MADNVAITPGVGAAIAADDIGSVFYQRVKAVLGADGVAADNPGMIEGGLTELIGEDEQVDQNEYSGSIGVALAATCSGTIEQVTLICGENGDGAILKPSGTLYILDADPAVAVGDAAITAAEWATVIAKLPIAAADWGTGDAAGAVAHPVIGLPVAFHSLANLYFVWFHTLATGFNDNEAHNESLDMNFWIRRES